MPRFKEVAARYMKIGDRTFYPGDVVRVISVSKRDAEILNSGTGTEPINGHGFTYEPEETPVIAKIAGVDKIEQDVPETVKKK